MSYKPTEEELKRIKNIFNQFDLNHDGEIATTELASVLKSLGQEYSPEDIKEIISSVDSDGNGCISMVEFINLVLYQSQREKNAEELLQAFSVFDRDGNGYISSAELKFVLQTLCLNVTDQEVQEIITEADCNGDGQISYEEFVKLISKS